MFPGQVFSFAKIAAIEFLFSASEQEFYAEKRLLKTRPGRCPVLQNKSANRTWLRQLRTQRRNTCLKPFVLHAVKKTTVPFEPTGDRPVYCRDCFQARRR